MLLPVLTDAIVELGCTATNLCQKRQVPRARGLGPALCVLEAREDSEHAKFKVNSRDQQGHLLLLGTALPLLPVCPIPLGLFPAGWRVLGTAAPQL